MLSQEKLIEAIKEFKRKNNNGDYSRNSSTYNNTILEAKGFKNGDVLEIDADYKVQFLARKGAIACCLYYKGRAVNKCLRYEIN